MSQASPAVVEVTDATFATQVIEESRKRPVVVDFWAEWCAPCRMIGPVLERLADELGGRFLLAKLDVDGNPEASAAFGIQSIPAVKAFRDGHVVQEFTGAIPEQNIRQFLQAVLPSEAEGVVERAEEAERSGRLDEAEGLYRQALEDDPRLERATLGAGRVAAARGDGAEAKRLLSPLRPEPEAERLLAKIEVSEWASPNGSGPLADAERAASEGRFQDALEVFLAAVRHGRDEERDLARERMIKVFAVLGEDHSLTVEYRRKLATALF